MKIDGSMTVSVQVTPWSVVFQELVPTTHQAVSSPTTEPK